MDNQQLQLGQDPPEQAPRPRLLYHPDHVIQNEIGAPQPIFLQCKELTANERNLVLAKIQKPIADWSFVEIKTYCFVLIAHLLKQLRIHKDQDQKELINTLSLDFTKELMKNFKFNTLHECMLACEMGIRDQLDVKTMGLSSISLFKWMTAFNDTEVRKNAMRVYNGFLDAFHKKENLNDHEKHEIIANGLMKCFEDYKENKVVGTDGFVYFNKLQEYGINWFNDEERMAMYEEAKAEMKLNLKKGRELSVSGSVNFQRLLVTIEGNQDIRTSNLAKRKALSRFFDKIIIKKLNLKKIYEDAFIEYRKRKQSEESAGQKAGS